MLGTFKDSGEGIVVGERWDAGQGVDREVSVMENKILTACYLSVMADVSWKGRASCSQDPATQRAIIDIIDYYR